MGSYTDRDGLAVITDNVWGPDGYPLDVDGNPIYFVDENGDTVSSGKDIAVYCLWSNKRVRRHHQI